MLDWRPRGSGFEPHRCHCLVSLSKNISPSLVLVQPRKTFPFITERLLMGRKESNLTNKLLYRCIIHCGCNYYCVVLTIRFKQIILAVFISNSWPYILMIWYICEIHQSLNEPVYSKIYKFACTPIEDSDQPAHQRSLIRVFDGRSIDSQESVSSGVKLRLIRPCRCTD